MLIIHYIPCRKLKPHKLHNSVLRDDIKKGLVLQGNILKSGQRLYSVDLITPKRKKATTYVWTTFESLEKDLNLLCKHMPFAGKIEKPLALF